MTRPYRISLVMLLVAGAGLFMRLHQDITVPMARPLAEIPRFHAGWRATADSEFSPGSLAVLKPTDYLMRTYRGPGGQQIGLYVGYHGGGKDGGGIHSPKNCLPGSGWYEVLSRKQTLALDGRTLNLVQAAYQFGESRMLLLYWFQVGDRTLNDEFQLKFAEIANSLLHRRRESTFVRVTVPYQTDQAGARALGESFLRDFYPVLSGFIPFAG